MIPRQTHDPSLEAFVRMMDQPDDDIDLPRVALLVALIEYPWLDIEPVLESLDALAARVAVRAPAHMPLLDRVEALMQVVIREQKLRGAPARSKDEYYDPRNSFPNDVLERKMGIPLGLSILLMGVAARVGIPLGGTRMPMHFVTRVLGISEPTFVDCYEGGRLLTLEQCRRAVEQMSDGQVAFKTEMLDVVSNAEIVMRYLTNLKLIYLSRRQFEKGLPILDRMLIIDPSELTLTRDRGLVQYTLGNYAQARIDLQQYLALSDNPDDAQQIRDILGELI